MAWLTAIMAGLGMLTGGLSSIWDYDKALADSKAEESNLKAQQQDQLGLMDLEWDTAVKEAGKQADKMDRNADRQDTMTTTQEGLASQGINNSLEGIRAQQDQEALSWNIYAMQNGAQTGDALSGMAASGTRSSSMATAVDMQSAINSAQLQAAEDAQRANDKGAINNAMNNLASANADIQNSRWNAMDMRNDATDLRNDYAEGGNQYNLFQQKRQNALNNYQRALDELKRERDYAKKNRWRSTLTGIFTGGSSGLTFGSKLQSYFKNL